MRYPITTATALVALASAVLALWNHELHAALGWGVAALSQWRIYAMMARQGATDS